MNNYKVSVIVPVYNTENFLRKCLDSIVNQTHSNLEIVVINDGSTDSSHKIIEEYAANDDRIISIQKKNGGIGSAYKVALDLISGEYVLFVDSDDWLDTIAIDELLSLAVKNESDIVYFGLRAFDEESNQVEIPILKSIDKINVTNEEILKTHFEIIKNPTLVRLFKKELFENLEIFEQNIGIDEILTIQLLQKSKRAVYTSKSYYNILLKTNSVSRSENNLQKINQTILIYRFLMNFAKKNIANYSNQIQYKYHLILIGFFVNVTCYSGNENSNLTMKFVRNDLQATRKSFYDVYRRMDKNANLSFKYKVNLINDFPWLAIVLLKISRFIRK